MKRPQLKFRNRCIPYLAGILKDLKVSSSPFNFINQILRKRD
jgi:hypothetical protein